MGAATQGRAGEGRLDLEDEAVWYTCLRAHAQVLDLLDRALVDRHSLTLAEYEVLSILATQPDGALRMRQLAERCRLSPSGLTRRFDALARAGLVVRERCDDDRRGVMATLTDAGAQRALEAAPTHDDAVRRHFLAHLDESSRSMLLSTMARVADATSF